MKNPVDELFFGRGPDFHSIKMEYWDNVSKSEEEIVVMALEMAFFTMIVITWIVYVVIFAQNFYQNERMKGLLSQKVVQTRHVHSAITLSYHMFKFVVWTSLVLVWITAMAFSGDGMARNYVILALDYEIAIVSVVEAISTVQSRAFFISLWQSGFGLKKVLFDKQD